MKLSRLIVIIAAIIVGAWCIGLLFRLTAWLLNGLVGIAAVVLVVALIYRWVAGTKSTTSTATKKG